MYRAGWSEEHSFFCELKIITVNSVCSVMHSHGDKITLKLCFQKCAKSLLQKNCQMFCCR